MTRRSRRPLTADEAREVRKIIRKVEWTTASSPRYRTAPHRYVIKFRTLGITKAEWDRFAELIAIAGVRRTWRGYSYKYLIVDRRCYWVDWPALNCASVTTLDPLPKSSRLRRAS
jgi:hypothetical protein